MNSRKSYFFTAFFFLLAFSPGSFFPCFGAEEEAEPDDIGGFQLKDAAKTVAQDFHVNVIVSFKVGKVPIAMKKTNDPVGRQMTRLAELANAGVIENKGIFVFLPRGAASEFSENPLMEGFSAPENISMDFRDVDIRDAVKLVSKRANVNVICEPSVRGNMSLHLSDVPWPLALHHIAAALGFRCSKAGNTIFVADRQHLETILKDFPETQPSEKKLSLTFLDTDIRDACEMVARHGSKDFISGSRVRGNSTISLLEVGEAEALQTVARSRGFSCFQKDGAWILADPNSLSDQKPLAQISFPDSKPVTLEFRDVAIESVISLIARSGNFEVGLSPKVSGRITLRLKDRKPGEILSLLAYSQGYSLQGDGKRVSLLANDDSPASVDFEYEKHGKKTEEAASPTENTSDPSSEENPQTETIVGFKTPPSPPISMNVRGIVGNDETRRALVVFQGAIMVLEKGGALQNKFKVTEILPDRIKIQTLKGFQESTFPLTF